MSAEGEGAKLRYTPGKEKPKSMPLWWIIFEIVTVLKVIGEKNNGT